MRIRNIRMRIKIKIRTKIKKFRRRNSIPNKYYNSVIIINIIIKKTFSNN